ncbi:era-like GTP-binding protein [Phlegmacium glaucopus]|nr:era-like GTP-binding protein [Phlegmacium glaucopus]
MASMNLKNTRQRAERFRVLIIGNANAGKTTILEKVCHAMGHKPKFLDAEGNEIVSELKSSDERGEHDIEHQIVYPTAQGFIFHDSRGFEAGATGELVKVKEFINERAKMTLMKDQLHAIWYCLPTSSDRPLTEAEMSLFESDIGNVPVIAVFTKMDALDKKVFSEQLNKKIPPREARKNVPSLARAKFERDYLAPLKKVSHQPKNIVELREMNKPDKDCNELVIKTAEALDSQALELLIISAHRNDVEFSIKRVINEQIIPLAQAVLKGAMFSQKEQKSLLRGAMVLFPHSLVRRATNIDYPV